MSNSIQQLLDDVESLKNILAAKATGERTDEAAYHRLRQRLATDALVKDKLPRFVRTCRTLGEFWPFIKEQHGTYAGRRRFLTKEFEAVLAFLEQQATTAGNEPINLVLNDIDADHVAAAWRKALERCPSDPSGAIASAQTLVETVCKHILDEQDLSYAESDDLPELYRLTAESLNLSPAQHTEQVFRQILGGCQAVIEGLVAMQNRDSDAQASKKASVHPASRHAELAVNLAGTMATFLLATWEAKHV
jgi:Abortive infection C-terminus